MLGGEAMKGAGRAWPKVLLGLLAGLVTFGALSWVGYLLPGPDCTYAHVIRGMVRTRDLLDPSIQAAPFLDKPPLFYWLGVVAVGALGETTLALRLVAVVAGASTMGLVVRLAARGSGGWATWALAVGGLVSTTWFVEYARRCTMEVPLALATLASVVLLWRAMARHAQGEDPTATFVAAGLAFAAALMLDRFAGVFAVLPFTTALVLGGRWSLLRSRGWWAWVLTAAAGAIPWHLYQYLSSGDVFLDFLTHHPPSTAAQGPLRQLWAAAVHEPILAASVVAGLSLASIRVARRGGAGVPEALETHLALAVVWMLVLFAVARAVTPPNVVLLTPVAVALFALLVGQALPRGWTRWLVALAMLAASWRGIDLYRPGGGFLHGAGPLVPAAKIAGLATSPDEVVHLLDLYPEAFRYYSDRACVTWWTDRTTYDRVRQTPYTRYAHDARLVPPGRTWDTVITMDPGLWILPRDTFDRMAAGSHVQVVYEGAGLVVIRSSPNP